jgi:hypothetical protein
MTAALANLIRSKPYGFITEQDIPAIIALDRLCWLLVRCGAQHGRFSAPAQNIAQLIATIEATGDWVRDVSFPSYLIDEARAFVAALPKGNPDPMAAHRRARHSLDDFNEHDCGGVFDGTGIVSDADPGL